VSPRCVVDIAEHSTCHPGRPSLHGEFQISPGGLVTVVVLRVFARGGLAHAVGLPQREVRRVALLRPLVGLALRFEVLDVLVRELPVVVERGHVEVDGAVRLVGVPLLDQRLDEVDDLRDVLGDAGVHLGAQQV